TQSIIAGGLSGTMGSLLTSTSPARASPPYPALTSAVTLPAGTSLQLNHTDSSSAMEPIRRLTYPARATRPSLISAATVRLGAFTSVAGLTMDSSCQEAS